MKASALVVTESEKGNQFILTVFSKSVVLRTKVPFNKSEVIALLSSVCLSVRLNCHDFALTLATRISIAELHIQLSA